MKIYLIGLPGAGKKTIGKLLAKKLKYEYIELDAIVAVNALMFTDTIIEKYGWKKYQELETEALKQIQTKDNIVVACGDNVVEVMSNKDLMDGEVIFLDVALEKIGERLEDDFYRDILKEKTLDQLSQERFLKHRNFATTIIDNNKSVDETLDVINKYLTIVM